MTDYQYSIARREFGKTLVTDGYTWLYDTLKGGPPYPYWISDAEKIVEETDKCVSTGGEFHVSKL